MKIEKVIQVTDEIVAGYARLIPQLSPTSPLPAAETLAQILAEGAVELFVAREEEHNAITGALALVLYRIPTGMRARIEDVVVDAAWRGRGAGEALLRAAMHRARERGANAVNLTCGPERESANRLYTRLGFQRVETNVYRHYFERQSAK